MSADNEKLQRFMEAVNSEIDLKVEKLLDEAEEEKRNIIAAAEERSQSTAEQHISAVTKKTGSKYVMEISRAELDMKKNVLRHREELSDRVFDAVKERIAEYRKTSAYFDGLVKTLVLINAGDGAEVRLSPDDMKYAADLKKAVKAQNVTFVQDDGIKLGGLAVYSAEKGTIVDKTYDLSLEEQRSAFVAGNSFA